VDLFELDLFYFYLAAMKGDDSYYDIMEIEDHDQYMSEEETDAKVCFNLSSIYKIFERVALSNILI